MWKIITIIIITIIVMNIIINLFYADMTRYFTNTKVTDQSQLRF